MLMLVFLTLFYQEIIYACYKISELYILCNNSEVSVFCLNFGNKIFTSYEIDKSFYKTNFKLYGSDENKFNQNVLFNA